jgi:hypothetical protein
MSSRFCTDRRRLRRDTRIRAVVPISTFDQWWPKQIGFKARNKAKHAEKTGIVIREVVLAEYSFPGIGKSTIPQQEDGPRK